MAIHDRNYGGKKNGTKFFIVLAIIGMIFMIGLISDTSEPKCIEPGGDNKQARIAVTAIFISHTKEHHQVKLYKK